MKCSHLSVPFFVSFLSPSVGKFFDVSGNICEVNKQIWRLLHINKENGNRRKSSYKGLKTKESKDTERKKKKKKKFKNWWRRKRKRQKRKENEVLKKWGYEEREKSRKKNPNTGCESFIWNSWTGSASVFRYFFRIL